MKLIHMQSHSKTNAKKNPMFLLSALNKLHLAHRLFGLALTVLKQQPKIGFVDMEDLAALGSILKGECGWRQPCSEGSWTQ